MKTNRSQNAEPVSHRSLSRRNFLKIAGIAGGASVLAACSSGQGTPAPQAGGTPAVITSKRKKLRLQTSYPVDYPNSLVMVNKVFGEFKQKYPDMEVEISFVRARDVARTFAQALKVDQAPDFFYAFENQGTLAYLGHLYDLTGLIKEAGVWDDLYQPAKDLWTFDGKLVGVPTYYGVKCHVYRADVWEEVGLDPDKFPSTWEDFTEAAIKLTKTDASGKIIRDGFDHRKDFEFLVSHIHQNGLAEYADELATAPSSLAAPESVEAFTWWCDLVRKHNTQARDARARPEGTESILDGYAGIALQGPWWVPEVRALKPELFDNGIIRVAPPLNRKNQVGHLDASGWGVNAHSDLLEETLEFVKIFLKEQNYMAYFDAVSEDGKTVYRMPTARRSINSNPNFWFAKESYVHETAFIKSFEMGRSTARKHLGYDQVQQFVYPRMIEQGIFQIKSDQAILESAAGQIDGITEQVQKELG
jgi:ABC-type glycerol-3-phosphate transport system substrate-binding protein